MLRIISLNLNGIRSAWSKNLLPWAAAQAPDVVCLQELKAQAPDLHPAMLRPDGLHAYYHCAEKKGYSGVGLWCRRPPDRVVEGIGNAEFDAEGRYLRADFGQLSVISLYLPSGSSSPERQEAKFRFMAEFSPPGKTPGRGAGNRHRRRLEHRPPGNRPEKLEVEPEEFRLPARRARLDESDLRPGRLGRRLSPALP